MDNNKENQETRNKWWYGQVRYRVQIKKEYYATEVNKNSLIFHWNLIFECSYEYLQNNSTFCHSYWNPLSLHFKLKMNGNFFYSTFSNKYVRHWLPTNMEFSSNWRRMYFPVTETEKEKEKDLIISNYQY